MSIDPLIIFGFIVLVILAYVAGRRRGIAFSDAAWHAAVPDIRKDAVQRSQSVKRGQFAEQLAPYLPDFPYNPTECRFVGKPIDFLVFKGAEAGKIGEIVFVEVKSGKASLSSQERHLKQAIEQQQVRWEEYRVPSDMDI